MDTAIVADPDARNVAALSRQWLLRHAMLVLSAITSLGLATRLWHLGTKPLWYDEAVLYWIAHAGWPELLARNAAENSAPPLFPMLVAAASTLTSREDGLRVLPLVFGVLTIPAVYWAARAIVDAELALAAAFITAVAPTAVLYSQYLREYSLAMLLSVVLIGAAGRYYRDGQVRDWLVIVGGSALALHCQYGLAFVVAGIGLGCLVRATAARRTRAELARLAVFGLVVGGSALLVWWSALSMQFQPGGWGATAYLRPYYWDGSLVGLVPFVVSRLFRVLAMPFHAYPPPLLQSVPAALVAAAGLGVAMVSPTRRPLAALVATSSGLTAAGAVLHLYPLGPIRQDAFLVAPLYVTAPLAFVGVAQLLRRLRLPATGPLSAALAVGFMLAVGPRTVETVTFRGWEHMPALLDGLERQRQSGDTVLVDPIAAPQFRYYYTPKPDDRLIVLTGRSVPPSDRETPPEDPVFAALRQLDGRVLLVTLAWASENRELTLRSGLERPVRLLEDETGAQLYVVEPISAAR